MPWNTWGTSQSVLLNESCHKKHEYIGLGLGICTVSKILAYNKVNWVGHGLVHHGRLPYCY